jgi:branched-chain amino acid transport system permease protein
VITAFGFAIASELLRAVEAPMNIGPIHIPGIAGMRMVVFSALLVLLMIFYRRGIFGQFELSWEWVRSLPGKVTDKEVQKKWTREDTSS